MSLFLNIVVNIFVVIVALLHIYFLTLEMFLWTTPLGWKTFKSTYEKHVATKVLAANQGLYNGFLSLGLLWGLFHPNPEFGVQIKAFFFICVAMAGLYGARTVSKKIFYIQALPALLGLLAILLSALSTTGV